MNQAAALMIRSANFEADFKLLSFRKSATLTAYVLNGKRRVGTLVICGVI